jgi:biopolymer transport protein TolR
MSRHKEKEMNFELDLLPVISMMSVCICFLLLTAVWTQVGSVNIEQGLGQESSRADQKQASLWVMMKANGDVDFKMMDAPEGTRNMSKTLFLGSKGSGWSALESHAAQIKEALPSLKTALIMPDAKVNYGDVIRMMDRLKILQIGEIGIAPL